MRIYEYNVWYKYVFLYSCVSQQFNSTKKVSPEWFKIIKSHYCFLNHKKNVSKNVKKPVVSRLNNY